MSSSNALSAMIVRNIGDIEAAIMHATEVIDERLQDEAFTAIQEALGESEWFFNRKKGALGSDWFVPRDWLDEDEDADPIFRLYSRDSEATHSWAALFIGQAPGAAQIEIMVHCNKPKARKAALADPEVRDALEKAAMSQDGKDIWIPAVLATEELAIGFESDDLTEALEPIRRAARTLAAAHPALDLVRERILAFGQ